MGEVGVMCTDGPAVGTANVQKQGVTAINGLRTYRWEKEGEMSRTFSNIIKYCSHRWHRIIQYDKEDEKQKQVRTLLSQYSHFFLLSNKKEKHGIFI